MPGRLPECRGLGGSNDRGATEGQPRSVPGGSPSAGRSNRSGVLCESVPHAPYGTSWDPVPVMGLASLILLLESFAVGSEW